MFRKSSHTSLSPQGFLQASEMKAPYAVAKALGAEDLGEEVEEPAAADVS